MPSLLYFLPDRRSGLSADEIRAAGLGYALDGPVHQQTLSDGPAMSSGGVLLADGRHCDLSRLRYAPGEQEWVGVQSSSAWVGRWKDEVFVPADLEREKPLAGHLVELADGNQWLCPVARGLAAEGGAVKYYHTLPRGVALDATGKWSKGQVVPRYRRLWKIAEAWWDTRVASVPTAAEVGDVVSFDFEGLVSAAVECLAANYRVGAVEVSMLGLFDSDSARKIVDALVDLPTLVVLSEELQKKTPSPAVGG
jgi:hypothetical protein